MGRRGRTSVTQSEGSDAGATLSKSGQLTHARLIPLRKVGEPPNSNLERSALSDRNGPHVSAATPIPLAMGAGRRGLSIVCRCDAPNDVAVRGRAKQLRSESLVGESR